jgi:hypothetical protein
MITLGSGSYIVQAMHNLRFLIHDCYKRSGRGRNHYRRR